MKLLKKHIFCVIKDQLFHMHALLFLSLLFAVPSAASTGPAAAASAPAGAVTDTLPPCTCRAEGRTYDMGDEICLATPAGRRIMRCAMVINMPSWTPTERSCDPATQ
jgi:hypothetical protein